MAENRFTHDDYRQYTDTSRSLIEGTVHKLNNILTGITTNASLIGMLSLRGGGETGHRIMGLSEKIENAVDNIDRLLTKMVDFTGSREQTGNICRPVSLIEGCHEILEILLRGRITLRKRLEDSPEIAFDPGTFVHLLYSLATYSYRQMEGKGEVAVSCRSVINPSLGNLRKGEYLELEFQLVGSFSAPAGEETEEKLSPLKRSSDEIINFVGTKVRETGGELTVSQPSETSQSVKLFFPAVNG